MAPTPPPSDNLFIGDLPAELTKEDVDRIFSSYGTVQDSRVLPPKSEGQNASALVRFASVEEASWIVENLNGNIAEGLTDPVVVRFANAPGSNWKAAGKDSKGGKAGWGEKEGGYGAWGGWGGKGGKDGKDGKDGKAAWRPMPYGKDGKGPGKGLGKMAAKGGGKPDCFKTVYSAARKGGVLGGGHVPEDCIIYVRNLPPDTTDLDLYKLFSPFGAIAPSGVRAMLEVDGSCKGIGFVDFSDSAAAAAAVMALDNLTMPDGSVINCTIKRPGKGKGKTGSDGKGE
eukprot:CAMPEP_0117484740 /NCGR_PEP_ID=MMETSP0784-20121206/14609_1 /TAXON_ID=39447 /ORGANISM="" /LENGTH=284 /DNA_ID=CAMNT_0005279313 /DNA_START=79 /DNA_END=933 /DNA_ORIENTATION=-